MYKAEQALWKEADLITFVYPLWWMGFPAILKGYIDRVLTHGFAYQVGRIPSVCSKGKKIQQFVTTGQYQRKYEQKGFLQSLDHTLGNGLFKLLRCGKGANALFRRNRHSNRGLSNGVGGGENQNTGNVTLGVTMLTFFYQLPNTRLIYRFSGRFIWHWRWADYCARISLSLPYGGRAA